MKIVFLTHHFPNPKEAGAPRPWHLVKYMASQGHKVVVVMAAYEYMSGAKTGSFGFRLWKKVPVELDNVHLIKVWGPAGYKKTILRRILAYTTFSVLAFLATLFTRNVSVVLVPNNPPTNTIFGYVLARIKGALFVEEIREPHPEIDNALGYFTAEPVRTLYEKYHVFFHRRSDLIVSLTPGITRILLEKRIPRSKILEVPNAYDVENDELLLKHSRREARELLGWGDEFVVLYAGSHGLAPRLETILEAAELLVDHSDIQFVMVGEGDKKQSLMEYAREHHLENCRFIQGQPREDIYTYYRAADVCTHVVPKGKFWKCVLPNKVFDYLGSGNPIIFAGEGDTADVINEAEAGYTVQPEDFRAFAHAVLRLYGNADKRRTMGENGRRYVLERFDRKKLQGILEETLIRAVQKRGQPGSKSRKLPTSSGSSGGSRVD